jgi:nitrate reductase gamma subunit
MHAVYNFVAGPLAWLAWAVFFLGIVYKLVKSYQSAKDKDPVVLNYMNLKYGLRSILHWSIPFGARNMRLNPVMTVVTFAFHLSLFIAPLFLMAHMIMLDEAVGFSFWTIPEGVADILTLVVLGACCFFAYRRLTIPEVKYVTTASDWGILAMVAAPFLTGFLAHYQIGPYNPMLILHILTGEIALVAIPFTRLSHMFYAPLTRAYIGAEFGAVRFAKDW